MRVALVALGLIAASAADAADLGKRKNVAPICVTTLNGDIGCLDMQRRLPDMLTDEGSKPRMASVLQGRNPHLPVPVNADLITYTAVLGNGLIATLCVCDPQEETKPIIVRDEVGRVLFETGRSSTAAVVSFLAEFAPNRPLPLPWAIGISKNPHE